jgi:uncharacterized membrane protein required for colicin V production
MGTWVDAVVLVMFVGLVFIEIKRGFGQAIFDLAAVLIAMRLAYVLVNPQGGVIRAAPSSEAVTYAVIFLALAVVMWFVGHLIYRSTLLNADMFDAFLGGVVGIFAATTVCHVFVTTLNLMAGPNDATNVVLNSPLAIEFLEFGMYHKILDFLYNVGK